jgi:hypothetical protein
MADYAKIASEAKAKQDAIALAAVEKLKLAEASSAFFKAIDTSLTKEINKANQELQKHGLLTGHRAAGIALTPKRFETQIRVNYGRTAICEVNFEQTHSRIQVELSIEPEAGGTPVISAMAFNLANGKTGAIARKLVAGQEAPGDFGAGEIAEIVVVGLIRCYFE